MSECVCAFFALLPSVCSCIWLFFIFVVAWLSVLSFFFGSLFGLVVFGFVVFYFVFAFLFLLVLWACGFLFFVVFYFTSAFLFVLFFWAWFSFLLFLILHFCLQALCEFPDEPGVYHSCKFSNLRMAIRTNESISKDGITYTPLKYLNGKVRVRIEKAKKNVQVGA